jgi:membrane-associated phospholipid phosphatase
MHSLSPTASTERHNQRSLLSRGRAAATVPIDWLDWGPWIIVGCLGVVATLWAMYERFAVKGGGGVAIAVLALIAASIYFCREERFLLCTTVLLQIVLFSSFFALLTYLAATTAVPLVDDRFAAWDAALGFDLLGLLAWLDRHPIISAILDVTYNTMLLQTAAVIVILGFANDRVPLRLFLLRMMLAGLVTFVFFVAMPAEGTPNQYGLTPTPLQAGFLEHLHALRSGLLRHFDFARVEGFIAFPSFHAIWAMLIVVACWHRPGVREFFAVLNSIVIVSTVTTGGHYLCDVLAGAVIAVAVCLLTPARKYRSPLAVDSSESQFRKELGRRNP